MKIGIIGAGAVGSILARELHKIQGAHVELTLMARSRRDGFSILENGQKTFHEITIHDVTAVDDKFDVIFIAAKTPALAQLKNHIIKMSHDSTELVYALNGMGYDDMFSGGIPSVVYVSGQQHGDYIEHFLNQKIILPEAPFHYLDQLIDYIESDSKVNFELIKTKDFKNIRYEKLLINVGINSVTALTKNTAKIFEDPAMVELTRTLLAESIAIVNRTENDIHIDQDFIDYAMDMYYGYPRHMGTSMYYDVMANKKTEFKYIQEYLYHLKEGLDITTPVLDVVVTLMRGYEMT